MGRLNFLIFSTFFKIFCNKPIFYNKILYKSCIKGEGKLYKEEENAGDETNKKHI